MDILIGADPEVFVLNRASGTFINADGMVKGTKQDPYPVLQGAVQVDGMALEFNIDPASTMEEFESNILTVRQQLHGMIGVGEFDLVANPSVMFSDEVMQCASSFSRQLGCEPDWNAWTFGYNPKPDDSSNMRTGAGHVHIGWTEGQNPEGFDHMDVCFELTQQLDCGLGTQSVLWDDDTDRRSMYGSAGAFRPKSYGSEYRVLSNAWLQSEELIRHVYRVAVHCTNDFFAGNIYKEVISNPISIINSSLKAEATSIQDTLYGEFGLPKLGVV